MMNISIFQKLIWVYSSSPHRWVGTTSRTVFHSMNLFLPKQCGIVFFCNIYKQDLTVSLLIGLSHWFLKVYCGSSVLNPWRNEKTKQYFCNFSAPFYLSLPKIWKFYFNYWFIILIHFQGDNTFFCIFASFLKIFYRLWLNAGCRIWNHQRMYVKSM